MNRGATNIINANGAICLRGKGAVAEEKFFCP